MGGFGSGGARNGAGRKPADGTPKQKVSVTLPAWLLSLIRGEADRRRIPASQLITELLIQGIEK